MVSLLFIEKITKTLVMEEFVWIHNIYCSVHVISTVMCSFELYKTARNLEVLIFWSLKH